MANNSRSMPTGVDYRWWLMVMLLMTGAATFLFLPSLMLKTTLALPAAAVSIAVALVAWLRPGSWHRRVSAGLFAMFGVILLVAALSQPIKESTTVSAWRIATACMLMGFALVVGLLTSLESRSRRIRRAATRRPPLNVATSTSAAAQTIPSPAAVPAVPRIDPDTVERVLSHHKPILARAGGTMLSPDTLIVRIRDSVRDALDRLAVRTNDPAAQAALDQVRGSCDLAPVQAALQEILDDPAASAADRPSLAREMASLYLLSSQPDRAQQYLQDILTTVPDDASTLHYLALAAELRGDLDQAETWYRRLLASTPDPALKLAAYGQLGLICQTRDDLDQAEDMHRHALALAEQSDRLDDVANQRSQLGAVYEMRCQVDQAESMYRRALEIHEQLGRLDGMAGQYVSLGLLASQRDDLPAARDLYARARDLYTRAGLTGNARLVEQLLDELVAS